MTVLTNDASSASSLPLYVVGLTTVAMFLVPSFILCVVAAIVLWTLIPILLLFSPIVIPALTILWVGLLLLGMLAFVYRRQWRPLII